MSYQKILITIDDSDTSNNIAFSGFDLASMLNAEVILLSVIDDRSVVSEMGIAFTEIEEKSRIEFKDHHRRLMSTIFNGYKVESRIEVGIIDEMIIKVSEDWSADLIVLGTHGRTGLAHVLLGSIAEKVIRHSKIPLLVIPMK